MAHTFPTLPIRAWILLAMFSLMAEAAGLKSCEKKYTRYRHPPLETLQWPGYWVPLMIILGGCCGLAWCILYMTYDMSQRGGNALPQLPSKAEEPPLPLDGQKEWSGMSFQADAKMEHLPYLERKPTAEKVVSFIRLERQFPSVVVNSASWAEDNVTMKQDRSVSQVEHKNSQRSVVAFAQPPESDVVAERVGSYAHLENNTLSERLGDPRSSESNAAEAKTQDMRQLEGHVNENQHLGLSSQEASDAPSQYPREEKCSHLWNFMEKELERLLGAMRLHRPASPSAPEQESPGIPRAERPEQPLTSESPATERAEPRAEADPVIPQREPHEPMMQLIICEVPRSHSRSPARTRGRRRRCCSKRRK